MPRCDAAELQLTVAGKCPTQSQVGEALTNPSVLTFYSPVYSIVPPEGESAEFAYKAFIITAVLFPRVRSESDYGLTVEVRNVATILPLEAATLALWGVPYDGLHDEHRFETNNGTVGASVTGAAIRPFSTSPTNCDTGPLTTGVKIRSWGKQETWHEEKFGASEQEGCVKSNEKQKVVIHDAYPGSKFTLSFEGKTTEALDYDSTAEEVEAALEALESIGESNVKVEGGQVPVPSASSASQLEFDSLGASAAVVEVCDRIRRSPEGPERAGNDGGRLRADRRRSLGDGRSRSQWQRRRTRIRPGSACDADHPQAPTSRPAST